MRISLIDPRWGKQRDVLLNKIKETTLASDEEIASNIVNLARNRPDIFDSTKIEITAKALSSRCLSGGGKFVNHPGPQDIQIRFRDNTKTSKYSKKYMKVQLHSLE